MIILETMSRSQKPKNWYMTLYPPKMQPHTKFWILSCNNIGDILWTRLLKIPNLVRGQGHSNQK